MAYYVNSSTLGVDLTQSQSSVAPTFGIGQIINGSDGSIWQYVQAETTVSAYSVVAINPSGIMNMAVLGMINGSTEGKQLAVSQFSFAPSEYGWVPVHGVGGPGGTFKVKVSGSVSAGLMLYIGTASGNLAITAAVSGTIEGIAVVTAMDTANTAVTAAPCILTWPRARTLGQ